MCSLGNDIALKNDCFYIEIFIKEDNVGIKSSFQIALVGKAHCLCGGLRDHFDSLFKEGIPA